MNYDQLFASTRTDVLTFRSELLTEPLTLAGEAFADLRVAISSTDADFVVKIIDEEKGGRQTLVRGEIMRGRYRRSLSTPEPFSPNRIDTVAITLPAFAHTFKKGHRIMVQVQSSWFPLFDMNPQQFINPYTCSREDFVKCDVSLFRTDSQRSSITFGVLGK